MYSTVAMLNPDAKYSNEDIDRIFKTIDEEQPTSFTVKPITKGTKLPSGWGGSCIPWNHDEDMEDMSLDKTLEYVEKYNKHEKLFMSIKSKLSKEEMKFIKEALSDNEWKQWDQ